MTLTLRRRKDSKAIDASVALRARKGDRLRIVKMQATIELPSAPPAAPATPAAPAAPAAKPEGGKA